MTDPEVRTMKCEAVWGLCRTSTLSENTTVPNGTSLAFGWTNVDFKKLENDPGFPLDPELIPGDPPLELILKILTSVNGDETNGPYDLLEPGVGLGIPIDLIDLGSFENLKNPQTEYDYDVRQRVFFIFSQPEPAKRFIETELCRPFGYYLAARNDGKIRCVRPRHPQKFYIGGSNNVVSHTPYGAQDLRTPPIPIGVYTAEELAAAIKLAAQGVSCQYNSAEHKFQLASHFPAAGGFRPFEIVTTAPDNIWRTIGFTSTVLVPNPLPVLAEEPRGALPQEIADERTLTENDMWDVRIIDNRDDRISSVGFHFDYEIGNGSFLSFRRYRDDESMHLQGITSSHDYTIRSRGLISGESSGKAWIYFRKRDVFSCTPQLKTIGQSHLFSVNADTWSELHARTLLDRYKQPPLKFRAKLMWKWNTLEIGDVVRVNYSKPGVFVDFERNATTLENRLFEVVAMNPSPDGIDVMFLGHRYVSY